MLYMHLADTLQAQDMLRFLLAADSLFAKTPAKLALRAHSGMHPSAPWAHAPVFTASLQLPTETSQIVFCLQDILLRCETNTRLSTNFVPYTMQSQMPWHIKPQDDSQNGCYDEAASTRAGHCLSAEK